MRIFILLSLEFRQPDRAGHPVALILLWLPGGFSQKEEKSLLFNGFLPL
jgi:hypothetical protein